jgi:hypothetical protein
MDIGKLIGWLVSVGLILGAMGTLGEVTAALRDHAARESRRGIISLKFFNSELVRAH